MPRFVILRHEPPAGSQRRLHWDLMFESGDVLRAWALAEAPAAGRSIAAEALADHRTAYLDYEGPISGNRGTATRWDAGTFQWERDTPREIVVRLNGQVLSGHVMLNRADEDSPTWQFVLQSAD
jgi:hypothetical protein